MRSSREDREEGEGNGSFSFVFFEIGLREFNANDCVDNEG